MKKKGQTTFNNENVHVFLQPSLDERFIDSSPASKSSAPSETNVSLLRVCRGLKNFLGPRDPERIGRA